MVHDMKRLCTAVVAASIIFASAGIAGCLGSITPGTGGHLTPARDLTGTWETKTPIIIYDLDLISGEPMNDITANIVMDIRQDGDKLSIIMETDPMSWKVNSTYAAENPGIGVPPIMESSSTALTGTVSSSRFTADRQGVLSYTHLDFMFTSDTMVGVISGNSRISGSNVTLMRVA
jgi:hypothetical protein